MVTTSLTEHHTPTEHNLCADCLPTGKRDKTIIVIVGATGVGKTEVALRIAEHYKTEIISADSRQVFRDIPIGTSAPTVEQQHRVKHHLVGFLNLDDYYSAAQYADDAWQCINTVLQTHDTVVLCGGSMLYIDAVCNGIDDIPTIPNDVRDHYLHKWQTEGASALCHELMLRDPEYYINVDRRNIKRVVHALEIIETTGTTYTSLRQRRRVTHAGINIVMIGIDRPREELFARINRRTDEMLAQGWLDEARKVYPLRHLNSLNTIGYKELFQYFDGTYTLDFAAERIKKNTRVYAKKQLTWFKRQHVSADNLPPVAVPSQLIQWYHPDDIDKLLAHLCNHSQ